MFDAKSVNIAKMNAMGHAVNISINNAAGSHVDPKEIVELAEKIVSWILNPDLKYVKMAVKETK